MKTKTEKERDQARAQACETWHELHPVGNGKERNVESLLSFHCLHPSCPKTRNHPTFSGHVVSLLMWSLEPSPFPLISFLDGTAPLLASSLLLALLFL